MSVKSRSSFGRSASRALVPALARWSSFRGAYLNLAVAGLVAVADVWLVHQTEYRIEAGSGSIAAIPGSAQHSYMAPLGVLLLALVAGLIVLAVLFLRLAARHRAALLAHLPDRLARHAYLGPLRLPAARVMGTGLALAALQIGLYALQENVERATIGGGWPGAAVLIAPQHRTVFLLHVLVALCAAIILWTIAALLKRSERATRFVRLLVQIVAGRATRPVQLAPVPARFPDLRPIAGTVSSRAPPVAFGTA